MAFTPSLCLHVAEKWLISFCFFYFFNKATDSIAPKLGPKFMISFNLNYLIKSLSTNSYIVGFNAWISEKQFLHYIPWPTKSVLIAWKIHSSSSQQPLSLKFILASNLKFLFNVSSKSGMMRLEIWFILRKNLFVAVISEARPRAMCFQKLMVWYAHGEQHFPETSKITFDQISMHRA